MKLPLYERFDRYQNGDVGVDIFCSKCLTHELYFTGGFSSTHDLCPCGCQDTTVWYKMTIGQKTRAKAIFNRDQKRDPQNG